METEKQLPEMTPEEALEAANRRIQELEETAEAETKSALRRYALDRAVETAGARDPELVRYLLERDAGEDIPAGLLALRETRPYLFGDDGGRPVFAAAVQGRDPGHEDEVVARRYQNNPWYRRK